MTSNQHVSLDFILAGTLQLVSSLSVELLAVMLTTLVCVFLANRLAPRMGLIDHPDGKRKLHSRPVPTTGGLAMLGGMWISTLLGADLADVHLRVLALLAIVATFHAIDDQSGLGASQRLILDAVMAFALIVITGEEIESIGVIAGVPITLGPAAIPITIVIYLTLSNAYNMIDGIDGLAISQFLISVLALGIWHAMSLPVQSADPLLAFFVSASLVVLLANLGVLGQRFRCFLGDCGSRFVAFFLAYAFICTGTRVLSPIEATFFVALPLFDLFCVVVERLRSHSNPTKADRRHFHHLLVDAGMRSSAAVIAMAFVSFGFITLLGISKAWQIDQGLTAIALIASGLTYGLYRRRLVRSLVGLRSRLSKAPQATRNA
jgi:UDP-GlcNAc:undecaprenyl-phosphate/decaprenyl-phosphate GlcNAc-1-phosphate transferase